MALFLLIEAHDYKLDSYLYQYLVLLDIISLNAYHVK